LPKAYPPTTSRLIAENCRSPHAVRAYSNCRSPHAVRASLSSPCDSNCRSPHAVRASLRLFPRPAIPLTDANGRSPHAVRASLRLFTRTAIALTDANGRSPHAVRASLRLFTGPAILLTDFRDRNHKIDRLATSFLRCARYKSVTVNPPISSRHLNIRLFDSRSDRA